MLQPVRERWLLLFNCQVLGLGNCLNLLSDRVEVEAFDPHHFRREADAIGKRLSAYDRVLAAPQLVPKAPFDLARHGTLWTLPTLSFNAYHPDILYLTGDGGTLKGPLGDYHSAIAFAAWRKGLDVAQAAALFRAETYAELGYFTRWDTARDRLLATFRDGGYDLATAFAQWTRAPQAFMYSSNHPRIGCVRDMARAVLARAGFEAEYTEALPSDNLANGPIFPVYPEIAAHLGVEGSLLFKPGGQYRYLRLHDYIEACFRVYHGTSRIEVLPECATLLDNAMTVIGRRT